MDQICWCGRYFSEHKSRPEGPGQQDEKFNYFQPGGRILQENDWIYCGGRWERIDIYAVGIGRSCNFPIAHLK